MNHHTSSTSAESQTGNDGCDGTVGAVTAIDQAIALLRRARDLLIRANAPRSADRVRRALKSVEGARRNADRFRCRTCNGKGRLDNSNDLLGTETCPTCAGTGRDRGSSS